MGDISKKTINEVLVPEYVEEGKRDNRVGLSEINTYSIKEPNSLKEIVKLVDEKRIFYKPYKCIEGTTN